MSRQPSLPSTEGHSSAQSNGSHVSRNFESPLDGFDPRKRRLRTGNGKAENGDKSGRSEKSPRARSLKAPSDEYGSNRESLLIREQTPTKTPPPTRGSGVDTPSRATDPRRRPRATSRNGASGDLSTPVRGAHHDAGKRDTPSVFRISLSERESGTRSGRHHRGSTDSTSAAAGVVGLLDHHSSQRKKKTSSDGHSKRKSESQEISSALKAGVRLKKRNTSCEASPPLSTQKTFLRPPSASGPGSDLPVSRPFDSGPNRCGGSRVGSGGLNSLAGTRHGSRDAVERVVTGSVLVGGQHTRHTSKRGTGGGSGSLVGMLVDEDEESDLDSLSLCSADSSVIRRFKSSRVDRAGGNCLSRARTGLRAGRRTRDEAGDRQAGPKPTDACIAQALQVAAALEMLPENDAAQLQDFVMSDERAARLQSPPGTPTSATIGLARRGSVESDAHPPVPLVWSPKPWLGPLAGPDDEGEMMCLGSACPLVDARWRPTKLLLRRLFSVVSRRLATFRSANPPQQHAVGDEGRTGSAESDRGDAGTYVSDEIAHF